MRAAGWLPLALAAVLMPAGLQAQPPSLVLADGGIEFPDGSVLDSATAVNPPATLTVAVDCTTGDSINDALENEADELVIEISGFCTENVYVRRDNVTFQGTDSATDGITGPSPGSSDPLLVDVKNASGVTFRNLTFANSSRHGLGTRSTRGIVVESCVFKDNGYDGANFWMASDAFIEDSSFEQNGRFGIRVGAASIVRAVDSVFEDNADSAVLAHEDAVVYLSGNACSVTATEEPMNGLEAYQDSFLYVTDCSLNVPNGMALHAFEQSDLNVVSISFVGDLTAEWKSLVFLGSSVQTTAGPNGNRFAHDSTLVLTFGDATLVGTTTFDTFSTGSIEGSDTYSFGTLLCETGGTWRVAVRRQPATPAPPAAASARRPPVITPTHS